MRIHGLQHVPFEGLGSIEAWAMRKGYEVEATRLYAGGALPDAGAVDWLVVMGGPMNVHEEQAYPWLPREKRFIEAVIRAGKPVLGICLGAQLIADVLGARVFAGKHREIGWFPVFRTREAVRSWVFRSFPPEMDVFHWHGDTFDLPPGCLRIAGSAACANQAFIYRECVVGLQFHLEVTRQGVEALVSHCREETGEGPYIQGAEEMLSRQDRFARANRQMERILEELSRLSGAG